MSIVTIDIYLTADCFYHIDINDPIYRVAVLRRYGHTRKPMLAGWNVVLYATGSKRV